MRTILTLAVFAILLAILGYLIVPRVPKLDSPATAATSVWNPNAVRSTLTGVRFASSIRITPRSFSPTTSITKPAPTINWRKGRAP